MNSIQRGLQRVHKNDPKMKRDGRCARSGCKNMVPEIAVSYGDPFCSSNCCRVYYGLQDPPADEKEQD